MVPLGNIIINEDPRKKICQIANVDPPFRALEIGFGNGEFLEYLASSSPRGVVFGIEVSLQCTARAVKRIQRSCLKNTRIVLGDARFVLGECFPPEWLHAVYMNFPCPWPKKRHAKRRVTYRGFSDVLAGSLAMGGAFEIFTDDPEYADEVAGELPLHPALSLESSILNPDREIRTKYERKWREQGKDLFLLRFRKKEPFLLPARKKEEKELHVSLDTPCPDLSIMSRLTGVEGKSASSRWVFKESFIGPSGVILVEAITSDEGFRQTFFIRIVPRGEGCLVKVDSFSRPFKTEAVSLAFSSLVEFLAGDKS
ncbi:MAG TPA: tRNA (guanosine(46)-N7)-methyltransferase TrmB [Synergistales bacterium]|nr:tRNA (guanosine(46)-N7)-methyltransferase TrmB [Synergistales bacterium]HRV70613.1 tRNA (guanosine(46)-N7)-methyltransferase TrmB [Thermovirgaceae bacterium]